MRPFRKPKRWRWPQFKILGKRDGDSRQTAWFVSVLLLLPASNCAAQDIQPRRWSHLPISGNFATLVYSDTFGDIFLDPTLRINNAKFQVHSGAAKYIRSFEFFGKSARLDISQAYQTGVWSGLINGTQTRVTRSGWADVIPRFAINVIGAPVLSPREFEKYRAQATAETILGLALALQLPTGQYFSDKLINLGENRIAVRPQFGAVRNVGKWTMEITGVSGFFTDNNAFFNGRHLKKRPTYGTDAHLIYTFQPGLWCSGSAAYSGGGKTFIDGVGSDNREENIAWALSLGVPITRALGLRLSYIETRTQISTGSDSNTLFCAFSVAW